MSKYYLQIVFLENCPYSIDALKLIKDNKIKHQLITVSHNEKDKYKTDLINTFPQIYLKKKGKPDSLLLGGRDNFKKILDSIKGNTDIDSIYNKLNEFNISKKSILRMIELFNQTSK
jgi:glutaredoxin